MKHYGFDNPEGSEIKNLTAPSGTTFPTGTENDGEFFFRTDEDKLYIYANSTWVDLTASSSGITDIVEDLTPQLGGDLDVNGNSIISTSNGDINLTPNGTGNVNLGNYTFDVDQIVGSAQNKHVLTYDDSTGNVSLEPLSVSRKNKLINGNFDIWQRETSHTWTTGLPSAYVADRWSCGSFLTSGSVDLTQESFNVGQTDVPHNPNYYMRIAGTSAVSPANAYIDFGQRIEDATTFAGETITFSFWGKASTSRKLGHYLYRVYGAGGSTNEVLSGTFAQISLTTSWQKFTVTIDVPSISGKTVGSGSYLSLGFRVVSKGNERTTLFGGWDEIGDLGSASVDIAQVQMELGNTATDFDIRTYANELMLCQRYYEKSYAANVNPGTVTNVNAVGTVASLSSSWLRGFEFKVPKRVQPSITLYSTVTGATGKVRNINTSADITSLPNYTGDSRVALISSSNLYTDGNVYMWHWTADSEF